MLRMEFVYGFGAKKNTPLGCFSKEFFTNLESRWRLVFVDVDREVGAIHFV